MGARGGGGGGILEAGRTIIILMKKKNKKMKNVNMLLSRYRYGHVNVYISRDKFKSWGTQETGIASHLDL